MKKQVWLRPDQVWLVRMCLEFADHQLASDPIPSPISKMAGAYTRKQIEEVLPLFETV